MFLRLIEVSESDATTLTDKLLSYFEKASIPLQNIIGYASDTTNVMFGAHHSVVSLLKENIPHLFVMKCLCHSAHLCASHSCEKLPRAVESFIRDIYSHFSHSAKRLAQFKQFQHFTNTEPHKILKPSQTRWLSLEQCVNRIIEQWSALELYFEQEAAKDRLLSLESIVGALKNPIFKLYFFFLSFILPKFTNFNKLFQSETPNIHFLSNYLASTYKAFLSCYLTSTYIRSTPLDSLNPSSSSHFLPLTSMNMGVQVSNLLITLSVNPSPSRQLEIKGFLEHVQLFFIEASCQIRNRFPIQDDILKSLTFLNPDTVNSVSATKIVQLASKFPNIVPSSNLGLLDDEWRELQFMEPIDLPQSSSSRNDVVEYWGKVGKMANTSGESRFPTIAKLAQSFLSFPHSNAEVERLFSQVTLIKTKHRNKLKTSTLESILQAKQSIQGSCLEFKPQRDMYDRFKLQMYDSDDTDSD